MLQRIFLLSQQQNERAIRFFVRSSLRVLSVVSVLFVIAYLALAYLSPFLLSFQSAIASFLAAFLVIPSVLAVGVAATGGAIILMQIAWSSIFFRKPILEIIPEIARILIIVLLGTLPAYLAFHGLLTGEIEHQSHRIKEQYSITDVPIGFFVHVSFHLILSISLYWYAYKLVVGIR